jgi:5'-deoxynucleotidase YfbR-like HD superfamily hydrolase
MTHMITISGAEYHFSGPGALAPEGRPIRISDIAHHLAQINRFTGATTRPYSVAEHSLLCADIAAHDGHPLAAQFALLMHDAHEAYTTDLSSPAKVAVNGYSMAAGGVAAWGLFEDVHANAVRREFNLTTAFAGYKNLIRQIDLQALATERRDLTAWKGGQHGAWAILHDFTSEQIRPVPWVNLASDEREATSWKAWRQAFLDRFAELQQKIIAQTAASLGKVSA